MEHRTHLPVPPAAAAEDTFAPLLSLLRDTLLKPKQVAARWGQGEDHLAALRRSRRGLPFIRLPGSKNGKGSIRYRLSDLIEAELTGTGGPIGVERVCLAIASCPDVPKERELRSRRTSDRRWRTASSVMPRPATRENVLPAGAMPRGLSHVHGAAEVAVSQMPWPRLMRAETAARYVDERSVRAFRRCVGKLYPRPIKLSGKGERWLKDQLDHAINSLFGSAGTIRDIADAL